MAEAKSDKIRVVIVGGGCAGLAAAWQLSQQPDYDVHVYEKSWRLGGKGASVRDHNGRILEHGLHVWLGFYENAFRMMRECYAEVERRNWGSHPGAKEKLTHSRVDEAFFPEPHIGVADPGSAGEWAAWSALLPPADGLPGAPLDERTNPFTLANYLLRCLSLLKTLMLSVIGPADWAGDFGQDGLSVDEAIDRDSIASMKLLIERVTSLLRTGSLVGAAMLAQAVSILEAWLQNLDLARSASDSVVTLAEALAAQTRKLLLDVARIDPEIRRKTEIIDIVITIAVGMFRDRILFDDRGLDAINHWDYREWLGHHGASKDALESRFLAGIYDLVFAYRDGDRSQPSLAAGVALRGALRMFLTYRGSMFWRMGSGMGDAVFAPLYKVLLAGRKLDAGENEYASAVTFHFMHDLTAVDFDLSQHDRRYLTSLRFVTRSRERNLFGSSATALNEHGCWPDKAEHCFGKVVDPNPRQKELKLGVDFDRVILALGIDDFKDVVAPHLRSSTDRGSHLPPHWSQMCEDVKSVATKSAQIWFRDSIETLGWQRGSGLITALGLSFSTWADMTHTLKSERPAQDVRSLAYFCDVLSKSEVDELREATQDQAVLQIQDALGQFAHELRSLHPTEAIGGDRGRKLLDTIVNFPIPRVLHGEISVALSQILASIAEQGSSITAHQLADHLAAATRSFPQDLLQITIRRKLDRDLDKLISQEMLGAWPTAFGTEGGAMSVESARYVQANFAGSDRYTLSLPVSTASRISPLDRSVENMTIAGDWTACGMDAGCIEAAVMSGMLAASAISGKPDPQSIVGYDHP